MLRGTTPRRVPRGRWWSAALLATGVHAFRHDRTFPSAPPWRHSRRRRRRTPLPGAWVQGARGPEPHSGGVVLAQKAAGSGHGLLPKLNPASCCCWHELERRWSDAAPFCAQWKCNFKRGGARVVRSVCFDISKKRGSVCSHHQDETLEPQRLCVVDDGGATPRCGR